MGSDAFRPRRSLPWRGLAIGTAVALVLFALPLITVLAIAVALVGAPGMASDTSLYTVEIGLHALMMAGFVVLLARIGRGWTDRDRKTFLTLLVVGAVGAVAFSVPVVVAALATIQPH